MKKRLGTRIILSPLVTDTADTIKWAFQVDEVKDTLALGKSSS